jgi:RNA polymerase sigma-70 factor (ECF subfamily)
MGMNELECIDRTLQGDPNAYENLVRRYQARLVAFLWNVLGNGDDARDAAQEVFVQAYVGLRRFDRSLSFRNWLFAIAHHRGIDLLRKKQSFRRFWERAALGGEPFIGATPPIEESPVWRLALRRITPQERSVLALMANEGLRAPEIAAMLGCREATVRVHLLNARRKLKKELHAAGFTVRSTEPGVGEVP